MSHYYCFLLSNRSLWPPIPCSGRFKPEIHPRIYESGTKRVVVGNWGVDWGQERESSHFLFFFVVVQWPSHVWLFMTPWAIISLLFISRYYPECFHYMCLLSHVWLCDPMDHSPPGSSIHGIFLARILRWVTIPFSRGSSWPEKVHLLHLLQLTVFSIDSWLVYYWAACEVLCFHHRIFFSFTNIQLRWLLFLFHTWSK